MQVEGESTRSTDPESPVPLEDRIWSIPVHFPPQRASGGGEECASLEAQEARSRPIGGRSNPIPRFNPPRLWRGRLGAGAFAARDASHCIPVFHGCGMQQRIGFFHRGLVRFGPNHGIPTFGLELFPR